MWDAEADGKYSSAHTMTTTYHIILFFETSRTHISRLSVIFLTRHYWDQFICVLDGLKDGWNRTVKESCYHTVVEWMH